MTKTMYQKATGAEETCMVCPHRICPKRDSDSYECPARVSEKNLGRVIKVALMQLKEQKQDISEKVMQILAGAEIK